jgi:undecaprenyl-diphosphatase
MTWPLLAAGAVCAVLFVWLGRRVGDHPPGRPDVPSRALRGPAIGPAIVFTDSGYGTVLTVLSIASIAAAFALRAPVGVPLTVVVSQILSQAAVNALKVVFARARPNAWLYRHELGYSYPSGHATTAVVFYGGWLVVLWNSSLPPAVRAAGAVVLTFWALGIGWSRIVLGAHYPTDVIGGYLFGAAWLCAVTALAAGGTGVLTRHI